MKNQNKSNKAFGRFYSAIITSSTTLLVSAFTSSTTSPLSIPTTQQNHPCCSFVIRQSHRCNNDLHSSSTALSMGLFDGVKDAFSAPALGRSTIDVDRETPIDRWMGWNVKPMDEQPDTSNDDTFFDAMDATNYISTKLQKPMGVVFEENDEEFGGIFALSLNEGGIAETDGIIKPGDQLISVNDQKVSGLDFDTSLGAIIDATTEETTLLFFRGTAKQLYGPTGASKEWLDEFVASKYSSATTTVATTEEEKKE